MPSLDYCSQVCASAKWSFDLRATLLGDFFKDLWKRVKLKLYFYALCFTITNLPLLLCFWWVSVAANKHVCTFTLCTRRNKCLTPGFSLRSHTYRRPTKTSIISLNQILVYEALLTNLSPLSSSSSSSLAASSDAPLLVAIKRLKPNVGEQQRLVSKTITVKIPYPRVLLS